jgi:hypothetical protein
MRQSCRARRLQHCNSRQGCYRLAQQQHTPHKQLTARHCQATH